MPSSAPDPPRTSRPAQPSPALSKLPMAAAGRVVFLQGDALPGDGAVPPSYKLLQLPNPSTGAAAQYVLTSAGLLELNRVKHAATSWLVDNEFVSDGSGFMATPINVVYVLLATLGWQPAEQVPGASSSSGSSMFQEAESLLCCEAWPAAQQLQALAAASLPCLCDVKDAGGDTYYRFNSRKALACLRLCVAQSLAAFRAASPGSIAGLPEQDARAYVLRLLKEYLSPAWHDTLLQSYGLSPALFNSADGGGATVRPAAAVAASPAADAAEKKQKVIDPKEAARRKAEESRAATAAAKLKQQAAGTKKISSFFTAKKPPAAGK